MIDPGDWRALFRLAALTMSALCFSCSGKEQVPGQLVVSVETDVALPKAVDTVKLEVLYRGVVQFGNVYTVGRNADIVIPATMTILEGADGKRDPVTIRVIGSKGSRPRTLRELITTMPVDRAASVRMPIQWLCDDRAELRSEGTVVSTCDEGYTCAAGRCVEKEVPEPTLPDYVPEDVFGGGSTPEEGRCFDTLGCMQSGTSAVPDADCTIERPVESSTTNVALRVKDDGICDDSGRPCFVPLDGNSDEGWRTAADRLTLPLAVCDRIASGRVDAVVVSTSCPTKGPAIPPCGAWSSVTNSLTPPVENSAPVGPSLIAEATSAGATLCCPLHADGELLYTCQCDGSQEVEVVAIDPERGSRTSAASFTLEEPRSFIATALVGDTLYFTDRGRLRSTLNGVSLATGDTSLLADIEADIFDTSPLLVDANSAYALASRVEDRGTDVQLVAFNRSSGAASSIAVGSKSGLQFDQDADALYVISHEDTGEGEELGRVSRILRIAKRDGATKPVATLTLQGADVERGGFVGLLVNEDSVLALSRKPLDASTDEVKLLDFDSQGRQAELFTQTVDAGRTKFLILGNSEEATLLVRLDLSSSAEDATVVGSTLRVVPHAGGFAPVNHTFGGDGPSNAAIRAPAFDPDGLYWVNSSGKVYRLPLSSLR